ncbi:uncharacterized protein [Haliotis asinina]|uniref:uncharacterized protein n=1 Tax=Haliotis asinina TaxID=109174 RepID=UPI003531F4F9
MNNQAKDVVSDVTEQESRLQKMEELVEMQEELLGKQGERLDQLNKSIKDQSKLCQVQDQMLSKMQASQLEEKSHLAAFGLQLQQLHGRLLALENVSSEMDSDKANGTVVTSPAVHNEKPKVKLTTIKNVGLSFALVMEHVTYSKMEEYCAQLVDSGRMIVLDSKSKMEALKTYLAYISEKRGNFYIGLRKRKRDGRHVWSNGETIDHAFWCNTRATHKNTCGAIKPRGQGKSCIGAVKCTKGRIICEKPL